MLLLSRKAGLSDLHIVIFARREMALRAAILPVDPLYGMAREVGAHRFIEGREEGLLAKAGEDPEALQLVFDRILHLGET